MGMDSTHSDVEIVRQVLAGDVNAFEILLQRHQEHVLHIVKKHAPYDRIADITHDVFVRAYAALPTFRHKSDFAHWLATIAVRTCYDFWRAHYQNREINLSALSAQQASRLETMQAEQSWRSFDGAAATRDAQVLLERALRALSAADRMVVELVYLDGLSGQEAAALLGWSVANVKVRLFRARQKLRKWLSSNKHQA